MADKLHILPAFLYDSSSRNVVKMSVSKQKSCRFKGSFRKVRNDFQRIADIGTGGRVNYKNLVFCKRNNPGINLKRTGKNIFHKALRRKAEMNIKNAALNRQHFFQDNPLYKIVVFRRVTWLGRNVRCRERLVVCGSFFCSSISCRIFCKLIFINRCICRI